MPIEQIIEARQRDLGGFTVGRVLPAVARRFVGPFAFLDHMGPIADGALAVRAHPHINLATVTYLFEGEIVHRDSLGSVQAIRPGAVNWMHAGQGIAHSERGAGAMHGLQLWVGLPRAHEDTAPAFDHYPAASLPSVTDGGVGARVLVGEAFGVRSPVVTHSPTIYADVGLAADARLELPAHRERAVYVIDGALTVDGTPIAPRVMAAVAPGPCVIRATADTRLVVLGGEPLDGPRYLWWNFVSSSPDRIRAAAADWRAGKFAAVPGETDSIPAPDLAFPEAPHA
jgi:redox-sensitive bicupin YhaK (pirin superfamily)